MLSISFIKLEAVNVCVRQHALPFTFTVNMHTITTGVRFPGIKNQITVTTVRRIVSVPNIDLKMHLHASFQIMLLCVNTDHI